VGEHRLRRAVKAREVSVCFAIALTVGATARADDRTIIERLSGARVCAHRGGYWFRDSNTIARFQKAVNEGADVVETDLQISGDGVPFLFHDDDLSPATLCRGPVSSYPASSIDRCRLHGLGHGPERFESALRWSSGRVVIDAEFKSPEVIRPAIDLVKRYSAYEWVYFQVGYQTKFYQEARAYDARVALEAAPRGPDAQLALDHLLGMDDPRLISLQLHPDLATDSNIGAIRRSGKVVAADGFRFGTEHQWVIWPFQRVAFCSELFHRGIGVVITNVPLSCAQQRDAAGSQALEVPLTH
jgi:glycerophosphoryl diester phosphodiesterase